MHNTTLIILLFLVPLIIGFFVNTILRSLSENFSKKKATASLGYGSSILIKRWLQKILVRRRLMTESRRLSPPKPVFLGASAPHVVRPGAEFTARFVAYASSLEHEIALQLSKLSPRAESHLRIKNCWWHSGAKVKVRLHGNYINVASPEEEFTWLGDSHLVEFDVEAYPLDTVTVLKFDVLIDEIIIAKLRIDLEISSKASLGPITTVTTQPARYAFASYASADRLRVLDRVSEIKRNGVEVFLDCLSLHPGEEWKPRLEKEIIERELFLLFWSTYAKQSEWVTWEWRTALKHKGLSGIDAHALDPVFEAEPPEELKGLHFGDPHMLMRKAYEQHEAKGFE